MDRIGWSSSATLVRTAANVTNYITSTVGLTTRCDYSVDPLNKFVDRIHQYISAESENLSTDNLILLAAGTQKATASLHQMTKEYSNDYFKQEKLLGSVQQLAADYTQITDVLRQV